MKKRKIGLLLLLIVFLAACSNKYKEAYSAGLKYLDEGNYEQAILSFTEAIEIDDKKQDAYLGRANAYMNSGRETEAIQDIESALHNGMKADKIPDNLVDPVIRDIIQSHEGNTQSLIEEMGQYGFFADNMKEYMQPYLYDLITAVAEDYYNDGKSVDEINKFLSNYGLSLADGPAASGDFSSLKQDYSKELVYAADYNLPTVVDSFNGYIDHTEPVYASDIIVPYINIDSPDAKKANDELYELYKYLIDIFNWDASHEQIWFTRVDSDAAVYNDVLSVVTQTVDQGTAASTYTYYMYNFSLKDGHRLSYEEALSIIGSDTSSIRETVLSMVWDELNDLGEYAGMSVNDTMSGYDANVSNNTVQFYFDEDGNLYVEVVLIAPIETGRIPTIFTIHYAN